MTRNHELEQLITHADQRLQKARTSVRALDADIADAQRALATLSALRAPSATAPGPQKCIRIATANGRHLTDGEVQNLNKEDYDIVLDMTNFTLTYREDPERRSEPRLSRLRGIGPYRITILAFMIERPDTPVCAENVDDLLGDTTRIATLQAFTKNISVLRKALGSGGNRNPYIRSVPAWESSRSNNARAYLLNPECKCLLIRHKKSQKSRISHEALIEESEAWGTVVT